MFFFLKFQPKAEYLSVFCELCAYYHENEHALSLKKIEISPQTYKCYLEVYMSKPNKQGEDRMNCISGRPSTDH